jgi:hypothetical protein
MQLAGLAMADDMDGVEIVPVAEISGNLVEAILRGVEQYDFRRIGNGGFQDGKVGHVGVDEHDGLGVGQRLHRQRTVHVARETDQIGGMKCAGWHVVHYRFGGVMVDMQGIRVESVDGSCQSGGIKHYAWFKSAQQRLALHGSEGT